MTKYVDIDAAKEAVRKAECNADYDGRRFDAEFIENALDFIPAADVAPVVYGRWVHLGGDEWCCSACGFVISTEGSWEKPTKKYCEDCGAKMDGGDSDAKSV
jgi:hypothetical protein